MKVTGFILSVHRESVSQYTPLASTAFQEGNNKQGITFHNLAILKYISAQNLRKPHSVFMPLK